MFVMLFVTLRINLRETECENVDCFHLAHGVIQFWAVVSTIMKLWLS